MSIEDKKESTNEKKEELFHLEFIPESGQFLTATEEYKTLWESESKKIMSGMEEVSGLKFPNSKIQAVVYEGISSLNWDDEGNYSLKLRGSYPVEVKKGTLIHELGHRLIAQITERPADMDEHRILFLILYDIWSKIYGQEFADEMVKIEKARKGVYDYVSAWNWALAFSWQERKKKFQDLITNF